MIRRLLALVASWRHLTAAGLAQSGTGDSWPTYHGDHSGRHYSPLKQVTVANVKNLSLAWVFRTTGSTQGGRPPAPAPAIKAMPLMVNGVLYLSTPNQVFAVDARTGEQIWHYAWPGHNAIGNRGVGMFGNWLYVATPDNSIISLDAPDGQGALEQEDGVGEGRQLQLVGARCHRQPRDRRHRRRWRWQPELPRITRSRDRGIAMEVAHHAGEGRAGHRDLAERGGRRPQRRGAVAAADLRSGPEPDLRHDRAADTHVQREGPRG